MMAAEDSNPTPVYCRVSTEFTAAANNDIGSAPPPSCNWIAVYRTKNAHVRNSASRCSPRRLLSYQEPPNTSLPSFASTWMIAPS